jgi:hypothetical protein
MRPLAAVQPLDEAGRGRLRVLSVDPLLLARALFLAEPGGAGVPIVDLAIEARAHFALHFVDLGDAARANLVQVFGHERTHRIAQGLRLDIPRQPGRDDRVGDGEPLLWRDRAAIKIGCGAAIHRRAVFLQEQELKSLGNGARFAGAAGARIADRVFEIDQKLGIQIRPPQYLQHRGL